jgi:uncharacterized protein DUF4255
VFIRNVDETLEKFVRDRLALNEDLGDVTFEAPTSNWSAQLSRITVNLFLYDVGLSSQPSRAAVRHVGDNGVAQVRPPQPMVRLGYLVSAWAGSPRDEHQLLGDLVSLFAASVSIPVEHTVGNLSSTIQVRLVADDVNRPRDVFAGSGGQLKAAFALEATVAADSYEWEGEAPRVDRIVALTNPIPRA